MNRKLLASSHEGRYTYWLDESDLYVYQRNFDDGEWAGWFCRFPSWDVFAASDWMQLV